VVEEGRVVRGERRTRRRVLVLGCDLRGSIGCFRARRYGRVRVGIRVRQPAFDERDAANKSQAVTRSSGRDTCSHPRLRAWPPILDQTHERGLPEFDMRAAAKAQLDDFERLSARLLAQAFDSH
jgi:hypothetical protein